MPANQIQRQLAVILTDKNLLSVVCLWTFAVYRNLCCFPHSLNSCHSTLLLLQELWQVLLPFMMTSKTPCLRSLWTNYGIKVMGCFIFAETLYSFTKLLVKHPLWGWITKVSKLLPYSTTAQNFALHGHLESTTPKLEDISNQDQILQRSLQPSTVVHPGFNLILFN